MSTTPYARNNRAIRFLFTFLVIAAIFVLALAFAGCSTPASSTPDPEATSAPAVEVTVEEEPAPEPPAIPVFGDTISYPDGVSISVSVPSEYTPTEYAAGLVDGQSNVVFNFVLTNNSTENFDPTLVYATASSGGLEASGVFDTTDGIGFPPQTAVTPGNAIQWAQAWSVANPADITMEVAVGFDRDPALFISPTQ